MFENRFCRSLLLHFFHKSFSHCSLLESCQILTSPVVVAAAQHPISLLPVPVSVPADGGVLLMTLSRVSSVLYTVAVVLQPRDKGLHMTVLVSNVPLVLYTSSTLKPSEISTRDYSSWFLHYECNCRPHFANCSSDPLPVTP
jgi:hypothetical protein